MPIAAQMPCPSEPVATSTKGSRGVGCPSRSQSSLRSERSSSRVRKPASAQAAYSSGAAWPFDSTKRSLSSCCGLRGSNRISAKNRVATMSAAEQQLDGWPLPASDVARTDSMRSRAAMVCSAGTSDDLSADTAPPERSLASFNQTGLRPEPPAFACGGPAPRAAPAEARLAESTPFCGAGLARGGRAPVSPGAPAPPAPRGPRPRPAGALRAAARRGSPRPAPGSRPRRSGGPDAPARAPPRS